MERPGAKALHGTRERGQVLAPVGGTGGLVIGPAGPLVSVHFDHLSALALTNYVQALARHGFRCFGLPASISPWLSPGQQERLRGLVKETGLRGWQTGAGHPLDDPRFGRPSPRWDAARAFNQRRVTFARACGLEGTILSVPADIVAPREQVEAHLRDVADEAGGGLWITNTASPSRRTGTAGDLAELCRATGANPCLNVPAHLHRSRRPAEPDALKEDLRQLGERTVIRYGNLLVHGAETEWGPYDPSLRDLHCPLPILLTAVRELGWVTPILVEGRNSEQSALAVLAAAGAH